MDIANPASALAVPRGRRTASAAATALGTLTVGAALAAGIGRYANRDVPGTDFARYWPLVVVGGLAYGATGGWLATARPRLTVGWLLLGIGAVLGSSALAGEYAIAAADRHPGWPGVSPLLWYYAWAWAAAYLVAGLVLPLLLPDGRLASAWHRPLLGAAVAATGLTALEFAVTPYDALVPPVSLPGLTNPVAAGWYDAPWLQVSAAVLTLFSLAAGLTVLLLRWHRAGRDRAALSVIVLGVLATVVLAVAAFPAPAGWEPLLAGVATVPLPVACVVAVTRHGLWDVDVVLSRTLAYVVLSGLAAVAYVAVVGGLGSALGSTTGLPVLVTAVIAVLVLPAHRRVQRLTNRLVHGAASDPYAALAELGRQLEAAGDPQAVGDHLLPEVVAAIARVVRAPVVLLLRDGDRVGAGVPGPTATSVPLAYAGEQVGALQVGGRPGALSAADRARLDGLARQAAVAVHGLLLDRELRRSRELLVSAREEERRRLRNDLHDGVGPTLAAAALQVETARDVYARDPAGAQAILDRAVGRLQDAVADVRTVVHGLRPPALDDLGLPGALTELATRFAGPDREVAVSATDVPGRSAAIDAAVYRVVAEALANAARHARAAHVTVDLHPSGDGLRVLVTDDGAGVAPSAAPGVGMGSMRDRAEELSGTLEVRPGADGRGTVVDLWLPLEAS